MVHERWNCYFSFSAIFCPFTPVTALKKKIPQKRKKTKAKKQKNKQQRQPGDIMILQMCTKHHDHMQYCSWDIWCVTDAIVIFILGYFLPFYCCGVCAIPEKIHTERFEDIYIFLKKPPEISRFANILLEKKILHLWILQNCVTPLQGFNPIFLQSSLTLPGFLELKIIDFSWFQPEMNYKIHKFFLTLNPRTLKDIQGGKFKDILLTMYVYQVFLLPMHYTLLSFWLHYPWFSLICITKKRNEYQKFCLI